MSSRVRLPLIESSCADGALAMRQVGFPKRDLDKLEKALVHTHCVLWVRATTKSRYAREGQLIGFARATSDGALSATIWDVAVCRA